MPEQPAASQTTVLNKNLRKEKKKRKPVQAAAEAASLSAKADPAPPIPTAKQQKAASSVIDSIFGSKTAAVEPYSADADDSIHPKSAVKAVRKRKKMTDVRGNKDDIFGVGPDKQRRYDEEGLPVYTVDELNVGTGGGTKNCPFDCDCCF